MSVTAGKASSSWQSLSDSYQTLYDSAVNGMVQTLRLDIGTADALVKITPHFRKMDNASALDEFLVEADDQLPIENSALGTGQFKIEAKCATSGNGSVCKWAAIGM